MRDVYTLFVFLLVVVFVMGVIISKWFVSLQNLNGVSVLARILTGTSAAGLLSLAFVARELSAQTLKLSDLLTDETTRNSLGLVLLLLITGASGLLYTLVWVCLDEALRRHTGWRSRVAQAIHQWVGGSAVAAAASVVLLFPAVIVLILTTTDIAVTP